MTYLEKQAEKIARENAKKYKVYCDWADRDPVCEFFSSKNECKESAMKMADIILDKAERLVTEMFTGVFQGETPEKMGKEFRQKLEG